MNSWISLLLHSYKLKYININFSSFRTLRFILSCHSLYHRLFTLYYKDYIYLKFLYLSVSLLSYALCKKILNITLCSVLQVSMWKLEKSSQLLFQIKVLNWRFEAHDTWLVVNRWVYKEEYGWLWYVGGDSKSSSRVGIEKKYNKVNM